MTDASIGRAPEHLKALRWRFDVGFALLLVPYPLVAYFTLFLLDDPKVSLLMNLARHYAVGSTLGYPVFLIVGAVWSRRELEKGSGRLKVLLAACFPATSALPYFVLGAPLLAVLTFLI